jgi:glycosyltransferase involved in cell wall biosynthesis
MTQTAYFVEKIQIFFKFLCGHDSWDCTTMGDMSVVIYDPTAADAQSKVRGIGRYLQLLRENLPDATFTGAIENSSGKATFVMPFINFTQPPLLKKRIAKTQIGVIHDLIPLKYPNEFPIGIRGRLNTFRNKQALKYYDVIVTISESTKADLVRILGIPDKKVVHIYPCLSASLSDTTGTKTASPNTPYFIYVGDATPNKNLVKLALAVQAADVTCYFAGSVFVQAARSDNPWNKQLNEFLQITKDDPRFVFKGYVSDNDLLGLYKGAIANILISKDEGFGFSFLEAAHCRTPSLLSDIRTFHEVAQESALFTPSADLEQIVTSLKLLSSEKTLRNELATKAYKTSKLYSATKFKNEWEQLFHR